VGTPTVASVIEAKTSRKNWKLDSMSLRMHRAYEQRKKNRRRQFTASGIYNWASGIRPRRRQT
jgi:hypothetical protein